MNTSHKFWRILSLVNFGLDMFILFFLLTAQWIEIPPFLQIFGRAHPLVLHFPIVFIVLLPLIPWILSGLSIEKENHRQLINHYLGLAHFLCALTVLFGLFLSMESGYSGQAVNNHKWGGIILLAILILLENTQALTRKQSKYASLIFLIPAFALIITSHIGSGITHGQNFLTEPIQKNIKPQVPLEQALVFEHVIHPILEQKCLNCHNQSKSKGDLILEDSASILRGGEDGPVLTRGNIAESPLYQRLILDIDHDDHMPPKGKPQLTQAEINLIEQWIGRERLFDVAYASLNPTDSLAVLIKTNYEYDDRPVYNMDPASEGVIQALNDDYRLLIPLAQESPALYARFLSAGHYQDEQLTALTDVKEQLVDLYLGNIPIDNSDLETIAQFPNLQVLNLNGTEISDEGLTHLYGLKELQKLYLTRTSITEEGIRDLLQSNPVKTVYLWGTEIDSTTIKSMLESFPGTNLVGISNPFGNDVIPLNPPQVEPDQPFLGFPGEVTFTHPIPEVSIRYTLDGSEPDSLNSLVYEDPIEINENTVLRVQAFKEGWLKSPLLTLHYYGRDIIPDSTWWINPPSPRYSGSGAATLVDLKAGENVLEDKSYLGYQEEAAELVFSFENPQVLSEVVVSSLTMTTSHIFPPARVEVNIEGEDGNWIAGGHSISEQPDSQVNYTKEYSTVTFSEPYTAKKVKITVTPVSRLPGWHPGKGAKGWVFLDEVLFQ